MGRSFWQFGSGHPERGAWDAPTRPWLRMTAAAPAKVGNSEAAGTEACRYAAAGEESGGARMGREVYSFGIPIAENERQTNSSVMAKQTAPMAGVAADYSIRRWSTSAGHVRLRTVSVLPRRRTSSLRGDAFFR